MAVSDRHATLVGRKVLAGLARGRQMAIAQAQAHSHQWESRIVLLLSLDIKEGNPVRGRSRRIAERLHGTLSESQVRRILSRSSVCKMK